MLDITHMVRSNALKAREVPPTIESESNGRPDRAYERVGPVAPLMRFDTVHRTNRGLRAILLSLMIAAAGASPALAADVQSGVSESYTVSATITVSNVPSTGVFTSPPACHPSVAGCLATDFSYAFVSTIGTNAGSGFSVSVKATTLDSGANSIPLSARGVVFGSAGGFTRNPAADNTNMGALSPTVDFLLGSTSAQGSVALGIEPLLRVDPSALAAGTYTGTLTVKASTNP